MGGVVLGGRGAGQGLGSTLMKKRSDEWSVNVNVN